MNGLVVAVFLWPLDSFLKITIVESALLSLSIPTLDISTHLPQNLALQVVLGLLVVDLAQYLRHRLLHTKLLWRFHTTHHSAVELRSSTHFRVHPVDYFISQIFYLVFLYLVGLPPEAVRWVLIMLVINNMWLHINLDLKYLYPLNYLLVSPNYHKWHHSAELEGQNKNYADLFPVFDIIGGTYYFPENRFPEKYGVMGVSKNHMLHQTFLGMLIYPFMKKRTSD